MSSPRRIVQRGAFNYGSLINISQGPLLLVVTTAVSERLRLRNLGPARYECWTMGQIVSYIYAVGLRELGSV